MQKVPGVTSVRVSLNEGLTVLDLKPGNTVTLLRLREVIRNNGFTTPEAKVTALGTAVASGSDLTFEVGGTRERFAVRTATNEQRQRADELRRSKSPTVTGSVDLRDPKSMKLDILSLSLP